MAKLTQKPIVGMELTLTLSENECRALEALTGYNFDAFVKCFYEHMGRVYLEPYEQDLKELFSSVQTILPSHLQRLDNARKAFNV